MNVAALRKVSWDEGQQSALRFLNQARESGEDLLYRLNRHIRRHPWRAVAIALGVGLVLGAVISYSAKD